MMHVALIPDVKVNSLFVDNAVLQRDRPIPVFGTGLPGKSVEVKFAGSVQKTVVDASGRWLVKFPARKAGEPLEIAVNGETVARNVVMGEVWIASGQSNMEWPLAATNQLTMAQPLANADIRCLTVTKTSVQQPAGDFTGTGWVQGSAGTIGSFSAVGYWFAQRLQRELGVPVGIINTSWGGTPAESWTSQSVLKNLPVYADRYKEYERYLGTDFQTAQAEYQKKLAEYNKARLDSGNEGERNGWQAANFADSSWKSVKLPGTVEGIVGRNIDGAFWFRTSVNLSASDAGSAAELTLGAIDDFDVTYINGQQVGKTNEEVPNHWQHPRKYAVPAGVLKSGENVIAVRVYDWSGGGGLTGPAESLALTVGGRKLTLAKDWKFTVEKEINPIPAPAQPFGPGNPWAPASLYNGMIAPLVPYGVRGAIWYQGESNADRAFQYRSLFRSMIEDWRNRFGQGDFPFLFVQLANYQSRSLTPTESGWAELREAQAMALSLKNTGMATAIDIGDSKDIHPQNKRDVGYRLAGVALAQTYRKKLEYYGPVFSKMEAKTGSITLRFTHAAGLRTVDGKAPKSFSIAGADRKFYWAEATIQDNAIVLRSSSVPNPVAARYAWDMDPEVNLVNASGLPAFPFRTDTWPGLTDKAR
jgi:sialate O-acetylesterase